jgi:enoyl-CoA hydratase/carnithine racemase
MADLILIEMAEGILTLTINRPEKKNAVTNEMYTGLCQGFTEAARAAKIKVVLIKGSGGVFTSGNDLKEFSIFIQNPGQFKEFRAFHLMKQLIGFPKPVVAAVNGLAVGFGTTILLHCDAVVAGRSAMFSLPFVKLGLVPEFASSYALPLMAGRVRASHVLMLGEPFGVEEARQMGIVSLVCEDGDVEAKALAICQQFVNLPARTLRTIKGLINPPERQEKMSIVLDEEMRLFQEGLTSAEHREAVAAFFEKRKPDFSKFD